MPNLETRWLTMLLGVEFALIASLSIWVWTIRKDFARRIRRADRTMDPSTATLLARDELRRHVAQLEAWRDEKRLLQARIDELYRRFWPPPREAPHNESRASGAQPARPEHEGLMGVSLAAENGSPAPSRSGPRALEARIREQLAGSGGPSRHLDERPPVEHANVSPAAAPPRDPVSSRAGVLPGPEACHAEEWGGSTPSPSPRVGSQPGELVAPWQATTCVDANADVPPAGYRTRDLVNAWVHFFTSDNGRNKGRIERLRDILRAELDSDITSVMPHPGIRNVAIVAVRDRTGWEQHYALPLWHEYNDKISALFDLSGGDQLSRIEGMLDPARVDATGEVQQKGTLTA